MYKSTCSFEQMFFLGQKNKLINMYNSALTNLLKNYIFSECIENLNCGHPVVFFLKDVQEGL